MHWIRILAALALTSSVLVVGTTGAVGAVSDECAALVNPVACENSLPGSPRSEWDVEGAGDPSIQGFATEFSVNEGETVRFKVKTDASDYRIDLYRLGWYGGLGARKLTTLAPSATLPQFQPECLNDAATGLVDCSNWAESATWAMPADAVSGVYLAKLVRTDTLGESHIVFVVRDDQGSSDVLFQTSDTTWQAYNRYGGNSLYSGSPAGRAYKVSYSRPFTTREYADPSWLFGSEYPMLRWLERNGYDVSYTTGIDTDRRGAELLDHQLFLSVGHDEYWSAGQRANVEAARDAGVDLGFFSGNEIFWKTRWEPGLDGSPHKTLVSYKETKAGAKIDPDPAWTGTWRDMRLSPPADGGRPENELTGTLFTVNAYRQDAIKIPADLGKLRFWRGTSVAALAAGATATLPAGTLGHEWDEPVDNGFRPAGLLRLSSTTLTVPAKIQDEGTTYATGTATHALTLYRAPSGSLVFGAGTVQWAWGLDSVHDTFTSGAPKPPDVRMQQATVNLFADMGPQPATLQSDLTTAAGSTDTAAPVSTITAPANGATLQSGTTYTISGTATDTDGLVAAVEVSTDGGATWHPATGRATWAYSWVAGGDETAMIRSRAVDDSGNLEAPGAGITASVLCPCRIWPTATPSTPSTTDTKGVELGVRFRASQDGWISGVRFYKGTNNTGAHTGSLWTNSGTLLARAVFTGETASGWQEVVFDTPIAITANTTYVASYHAPTGGYAITPNGFSSSGFANDPLTALQSGVDGGNGLYSYSDAPTRPTSSHLASNYWVDVVFDTRQPADTVNPRVVGVTPKANSTDADARGAITAAFSEGMEAATISASSFLLEAPEGTTVSGIVSYDAASRTATFQPSTELAFSATYTATVKGGAAGVKDLAGRSMSPDFIWSFTTAPPRVCPCSLWSSTAVPATTASADGNAVEVGVKFQADADGWIDGIRFFKGTGNGGTHFGSLWTASGTLLARATFTSETASGWQQASFGGAIPIRAGTTYVASYHAPNGRYALTGNAFAGAGLDNPPLRALRSGLEGGNGVFSYGPAPTFPTQTFQAANYWVDVVFLTVRPADDSPPQVAERVPVDGANGVPTSRAITVTFSEPMDATTIGSSTFELRDAGGAPVPATVTYAPETRTAALQPTGALALEATYVATVRGGSAGVRDESGNQLLDDVAWSFATKACPCSLFDAGARPRIESSNDGGSVELGIRFRPDVAGYVSGIRFYKGSRNSGVHVGSLWSESGALLARATFADESATGWQEVVFGAPVAVSAGATYVASYHAPAGGYAVDVGAFAAALDNSPLHAHAGANGVYAYAATPVFPGSSYESSNYWVDVAFDTSPPADSLPPTVSAASPIGGATGIPLASIIRARFSEALDAASLSDATFQLRNAAGTLVPGAVSYDSTAREATFVPAARLELGETYAARIVGGSAGVKDESGNPLAVDYAWAFTAKACPCTIFSPTSQPLVSSAGGAAAVELGLKFRVDVPGRVTGLRFFKGSGNTGTHVGSLWTLSGTLLGRATFADESADGWQQVSFSEPVSVEPGTTYVVSYHAPNGGYAVDLLGVSNDIASPPLSAIADGVDGGNGVYSYSVEPTFPTGTYQASNYWVDVVFTDAK